VLTCSEKEVVVIDLLKEVMVRIEKQLLEPATFTVKQQKEGSCSDVHVFLHGSSASHFSSIDFLWEMVAGFDERIRQVNELADYFISFFINELKREAERDAIEEVVGNLEYVYGQKMNVEYWFDEEKGQHMVTFIPFQPKFKITVSAGQVEREYNNRFSLEEDIDILADLADLMKAFYRGGLEEAALLAEKLNRNIVIEPI
jgi:hypothetical protein